MLDEAKQFAGAYINDVIIYSCTWEEHLHHIQEVLQRLRLADLTVKARKCQFGMAKCNYLGHVIGGGKVQPEDSKLKAIQSFPKPTTKKGVQSFLGITGYIYSGLFLYCCSTD